MKQIVIFSLLFISLKAYPQNQSYIIKLCLPALIDEFSFPTIQGGFEARLSDRFASYSEVGIKYRKGYYEGADTTFLKPYGFKVKTEVRYYFAKKRKVDNTAPAIVNYYKYVGFNVFCIRDVHNMSLTYYDKNDSTVEIGDNLGVKKSVFGFNFVFGLQKHLSKHFFYDFYFGVGYRFVFIHNVHQEYDPAKDGIHGPIDINLNSLIDRVNIIQGFNTYPNLTVGIRFCFQL